MSYKSGDIVVVRFPFALRNGNEIQKGRPALVISDDKVKRRYNDVILAAITSQVPNDIMGSGGRWCGEFREGERIEGQLNFRKSINHEYDA
jgi:hypothetical protein